MGLNLSLGVFFGITFNHSPLTDSEMSNKAMVKQSFAFLKMRNSYLQEVLNLLDNFVYHIFGSFFVTVALLAWQDLNCISHK